MTGKTNRADLIEGIADECRISKRAAEQALASALGLITRHVDAGRTVAIHGFGTFEPRVRAARTGRNPRTGEAIAIPASTAMGFRPAKRRGA